jgi:3-oxoacyl-[acyl-carrier protein] reductase
MPLATLTAEAARLPLRCIPRAGAESARAVGGGANDEPRSQQHPTTRGDRHRWIPRDRPCRRRAPSCDGYAVAIGFLGNDAAAKEVVEGIVAGGSSAIAAQADIADPAAVVELFDAAERAFGGIDVVVNAAGMMVLSPVVELDLDDLDRMYRTNIRGTFVVNQPAARRLRDGGAIINFSSSVVKLALPTYAAYAASKAAVDELSLILARELRGRNITVNALAPGPTATDLFLDGKDEATVERMASASPLERLGAPADIAELVAELAGPAHWVDGQTIYANGGLV